MLYEVITPLSINIFSKILEPSGSSRGWRIWSSSSTTVTNTPDSASATAFFIPTRPPPRTTAFFAPFAAHYGFWAQPCRVYTPTDKGKVESNVKYVKDNCFKGREFKDIADAKEFRNNFV